MKKKEITAVLILIPAIAALQGLSFWSSSRKSIVFSSAVRQEQAFSEDEKTKEDEEEFKLKREDVLEPDKFQALAFEPLSLELLGTAMGNIKEPIAFIKDLQTGKQGMYKIGGVVQEARIIKIARGEVTLTRGGYEEILRLSSRGLRWADAGTGNSTEPITASGSSLIINAAALKKEAARLYKDLKSVKVTSYRENGRPVGLKVEAVPEGSIFEAAGIKSNDVITMVNGQRIDSYQKALQVSRKMRHLPEINVGLLREGETRLLKYKIR